MSNNRTPVTGLMNEDEQAQFLFEMSCLMTFLSTGLIYTLLYDSARKLILKLTRS